MSTRPEHHAIIVSISSDIGLAAAERWAARGVTLTGTCRTESAAVRALRAAGAAILPCDLADPSAPARTVHRMLTDRPTWDTLLLCPGAQEPVGAFVDVDVDEWAQSIVVNFTAQMAIVHGLLPHRRRGSTLGPCVIFFAGGGTNNAPVNYSAYIVAKIATVKMCELLHAEIADARFVILGPGWVKTKIHEATLQAGASRAGANYQRTVETLASDRCTPMARVLDCLDWVLASPRSVIGGRNLSVVFDRWGDEVLSSQLEADPDMYTLRRSGNAWQPTSGTTDNGDGHDRT